MFSRKSVENANSNNNVEFIFPLRFHQQKSMNLAEWLAVKSA